MDLPAPSFSLLNTSNSQGLTPSDSLSFPSEPPEIGKWFSSYGYESPMLIIGENTEFSESIRQNDREKEEYDVEETDKNKEGNLAELQKPRKRDRFVAEENVDSKGVVRCKNAIGPNSYEGQVLGSPDSLLLTSEPPDIKNWFSSYAYESPALESSDDIEFSDNKENIVDIVGCTTEKVSSAEEESKGSTRIGRNDGFVGEKMASGGYNKSKRSLETNEYACKGNNGVDEDHASSAPTEVPSKKTSELILEEKRAKDHDNASTKVAELSNFNVKDPTEKLCNELPEVANCSVHNDELSPKRLISWRDSTKEGSEGKAQTKDECNISARSKSDIIAVDGDSWNRISRSSNKENDGNDFAATRFVSARKSSSRRENDENSLTNLVGDRSERLQNGARVSADGHKVQRKVLSETTNIRHSDALEITGKWRCPQKSKPNLGPPLKQLRLERWVHRV